MAQNGDNTARNNGHKHLALICQHFYPEMISTGMHMTELATGLAGRGHAIRVYCARPAYGEYADQELPRRDSYGGVRIVRLPSLGDPRRGLLSRGLFAMTYLMATLWFLLRERRRLAGVITTTNPPFIGLVAVALRRLANVPYVTIVYDVYPEIAVRLGAVPERSPLTWLWAAITRLIFRRSQHLVVIGRDMAQIVRDKLGGECHGKVRFIPNWSDERRVKPVPPDQNRFVQTHRLQDRFVVQYSGRMGRTHNLEPLLDAAALLHEEPVLLQLIGDGAKRQMLLSMAREQGLQNVQFLPYQPFERLDEVLSAPDLAVVCLDRRFTGLSVPSKTYGIMAGGRPILGFLDPAGEIARTITEHQCGVILPEPDGEQVAAVVRRLMKDRQELRRLGQNGRRAFLQEYTLSHALDRYDRLLRHSFY